MNLYPGLVITAVIVLSDVITGSDVQEHKRRIAAFLGGSITLPCPASPSTGNTSNASQTVEWADLVYNEDQNPIVIHNSESGINEKHMNKDNYNVSDDNRLKISKLKDDDSGQYFCSVSSDGEVKHKHSYALSLYGKPECQGEANVVEGTDVELACSVSLGADHLPNIKWSNSRGAVKSKDATGDPFNAVRQTNIKASWLDDGATYTCVIQLSDSEDVSEDSCSINFTVKYQPRNLKVEPDREVYAVGDILYFTAMGNPKPVITLEPTGQNATEGGPITLTITAEMTDKDHTFVLRAENELTNDPVTYSKSFRVVKAHSGGPSGLGGNGKAHLCAGLLGLFVLFTKKVLL